MTARRFWVALGLVVAAAAGVRIAFTATVDPHAHCAPDPAIDRALAARHIPAKERCLTDALAYHLLGDNLARGRGYIRPFDDAILHIARPTAEYPPLYPAVIAAVDKVGIHGIDAQQLVLGPLIGGIATLLIGLLGRALGGNAVGLAAAVVAAVHPMLLGADALLMTEGLFVALAAAVLLVALAMQARPNHRRAAILGALLALGALCRADALVWIPVVVIALWIAMPGTGRGRAAYALTVVVTSALVLTPWTVRNAAHFHSFVAVSNNLGTVLAGANCDLTYSGPTLGAWRSTFVPGRPHGTECFPGFAIDAPGFDEASAANAARRDGLHYARHHTGRLPIVAVARVARTFGLWPHPGEQVDLAVLEGRSRRAEWLGTLLEWPLLVLGAFGLWARRRDRRILVVLAAPVAVAVTTLATYGNPRFRSGAEPAIIVLAALGAAAVIEGARGRRRPHDPETLPSPVSGAGA